MGSLRTLTIVKTDIRGFTDRVATMRVGELDQFLATHRDLVHQAMTSHGGHVVKNLGDSYLVTFQSSTVALQACIDLQRTLARTSASMADAVEVRIAVTAGDVLMQDGDIFGTPVNLVARLEGETPAGEIHFTETVRLNLNPNEIVHEPMGTYRFKGVPDPVDVYRTTFRHQTRVVSDAWVMWTDLRGFSSFALTAALDEVEAVLLAWETANREAIADHNGVLLNVVGDGFLSSFRTSEHALGAYASIYAYTKAFNTETRRSFPIFLTAGLDHGEIRVFRVATYGDAISRAARCCSQARPVETSSLVMSKDLIDRIPPEQFRAAGLVVGHFDRQAAERLRTQSVAARIDAQIPAMVEIVSET